MKSSLFALALAFAPVVLAPALVPTPTYAAATVGQLGDLSSFHKIIQDTLDLVNKNDLAGAAKRITDYETAWDKAQSTLQPKNKALWRSLDGASDVAITAVRDKKQDVAAMKKALSDFLVALDNPK